MTSENNDILSKLSDTGKTVDGPRSTVHGRMSTVDGAVNDVLINHTRNHVAASPGYDSDLINHRAYHEGAYSH